jgi:hypothetical protein
VAPDFKHARRCFADALPNCRAKFDHYCCSGRTPYVSGLNLASRYSAGAAKVTRKKQTATQSSKHIGLARNVSPSLTVCDYNFESTGVKSPRANQPAVKTVYYQVHVATINEK